MTQENLILSHLLSGASLTPLDALDRFGCFRLGARICDLRKQGHAIHSERIRLPSGKFVSRYSMRPLLVIAA